MARPGGRASDAIRPVSITRHFQGTSPGSVLYRAGRTTLLVSAQVSDSVPPFLTGKGTGWLTAEYAMLPGSTPTRKDRRTDGRATEIQRLIGRSLRAVVDFSALGPCTVQIDADVLEADGGTRTAAITAGFVALVDALQSKMPDRVGAILKDSIAAVSVGLLHDAPLLDLEYVEDSVAEVDFNVVGLGRGSLIEVQGTGEAGSFSRAQLTALLDLAEAGMGSLRQAQREALGSAWPFS